MARQTIITRMAERGGLALYGGFIAACWSALALAEVGRFRAGTPLAIAGAAALALAFLPRRDAEPGAPEGGDARGLLRALAVAAASLVLTLPASEMALGGWDPGVYLQTAAAVSDTGSLRFPSPGVAGLSPEAQRLLTRDWGNFRELFGGMRLLPDGRITPQFFHLYPSAMAIAHGLGGARAALLVNPLLNACSLLALFVLATRLLGRPWGLVAAMLLCLNPAQIWQAKFCTAEMMTQLFLLGGFALLLPIVSGAGRASALTAALAGLSFGMALLTRYDTLLVLVPLALALWVGLPAVRHPRLLAPAAVAFALPAAHAWLHARLVAPFYRPLSREILLLSGLLLGLTAALVLVLRILRRRGSRFATQWLPAWVPRLAAGGFAAWAAYAWLIRPCAPERLTDIYWLQRLALAAKQGMLYYQISSDDAVNMLYVANSLGFAGMAVAAAGVALLLARWRERGRWAWMIPGAAVMVVFVTALFNNHFMLWSTRRFIPVVFPLMAVGGAAVAAALAGPAGAAPWRRYAAALAIGATVLLNLRPIATVARHRDWPGLLDWLESVDRALPPGAVVYADEGVASALRFLHGREAYSPGRIRPGRREAWSRLLAEQLKDGRAVYTLSEEPLCGGAGVAEELQQELPLQSGILEQRRRSFPLTVKQRSGRYELRRVLPLSEAAPQSGL